ncbi:MAG TPA: acyl-CoA dehydrogenase family protein [Aquabacterium sp.]|uniref:acyl-CoA dehydrogenase family protein n=1 Tax=Aquabacterium sp. TaxID=1872578 RepID=UPI002E35242A|nr:acyl-CoA dehydrogenase family protein [Aquabacterium sp.]HEX5373322.1 acyl-CoA dehydrogenase family protein [Aquabacterium sp.]
MDFDFSSDQEQLRDMVQRWVSKDYGFEHRRGLALAGGSQGIDPSSAWQALGELGLLGLAVPGEFGGMDMGPVEAMVVMEELGRGMVAAPYAAASLMGAGLLRDHAPDDIRSHWLPLIAEGQARVLPALQERGARHRLNVVHTQARQDAVGQWTLTGTKNLVPVGGDDGVTEAYIVPARVSGGVDDTQGIALFLVQRGAAGVRLAVHALQDNARAAELTLQQASATLVLAQGWPALEHMVDIGIAALCAEAVGAMESLLALTVDYLNTRKQFGVLIGSFQALRHRAADMKMQLELARSMSYYATLKLTAPAAERRRALAQAKVQLGQSMRFVGQQAIQLHGGIGVTDEYAAAHYFKRLTCMELSLGDTLHHLGEVSARMEDSAGVFA